MNQPEFDHPTRGRSYGHAHDEMPKVREAELSYMFDFVSPQPGERILEFGAGNGLLSVRLNRAIAPGGRFMAADNAASVGRMLDGKIPGIDFRLVKDDRLPVDSESVDKVASLANFHHVNDKLLVLSEFARVLIEGGTLYVGDVLAGTGVQAYFDEVVDKICSTGHKHTFLEQSNLEELCRAARLTLLGAQVVRVPWVFASPGEAGWFLKRIHDAHLTDERKCLELAREYLGFNQIANDRFELDWELIFFSAVKW